MFTVYQVLSLALEFVVTIVAVWGVVTRLQSSLKSEIRESIADMKIAHHDTITESRENFKSINSSFEGIRLQINTILEGHVRDLQTRVNRLEAGQDEWTKELRKRTHDLGDAVNKQGYEIDSLRRKFNTTGE
jgi:hypothetical protein